MILKALRRIPFLAQIRPKDLRRICKLSRIHAYQAGEPIFSKADSGSQMFIVLKGRVKIFSPSQARKRKTLAYLEPGEFFGEMALLGGKIRSASAQASSDTSLLVISRSDFKRLLISDPQLTCFLLRRVSERLRRADAEIDALLFKNVLGRVSKTLCDLARRGRRFGSGLLLRRHFTQQELADLVGTTREPLTRALSALRRAQLIETRDGHYYITDLEKLRALGAPS